MQQPLTFSYTDSLSMLQEMSYSQGVKLGLETMQKVMNALSSPEKEYEVIHVAGTNGKGSVCWKLAQSLSTDSCRVGLYSSPHISSVRERIRVDGQLITEKEFAEAFTKVYQAALPYKISLSFFEMLTAMAFLHFADKQVDLAVVEVGLGGRLDATNIVESPLLSIITSVSLDHQNILGQTREEIAQEKGGIIKPTKPVLLGPGATGIGLEKLAKERQAPLLLTDSDADADWEEKNSKTARTALRFCAQSLHHMQVDLKGLVAKPPCRFELMSPLAETPIVMDVAHNLEGLKALYHKVQKQFPQHAIVSAIGMGERDDLEACLQVVFTHSSQVYWLDVRHPRLASFARLQQANATREMLSLHPKEIRHWVEKIETGEKKVILFTGSFFIQSEVRYALGIEEARDDCFLQDPKASVK